MDKSKILKNTIDKLHKLDDQSLKEANTFVDYLLTRISDGEITREIQKQAEKSGSFSFLEEEENLYSINDLKEDYK